MKAEEKAAGPNSHVSDARRLFESGVEAEIVTGVLRERGLDKLDSMKTLVGATGMSLGEAKRIVHSSRTWQDSFARDEKFHDSLLQAVQILDSGWAASKPSKG